MAKKQTRKPNFSKMTIDELQAAYDSDWPIDIKLFWKEEMVQREVPISKHLKPYLDIDDFMGPNLSHPFYVGYVNPERAALVNWSIERKRLEIEKLVSKKKWSHVVFMHHTTFLLDAFEQYVERFDDKSYWKILAAIWTHQEQLWHNKNHYLMLFQSPRSQRQCLMTAAERRKLDSMPDEFPVYRGYIGRRGKGLSWTIDQSKAEWFAQRFSLLTDLGKPRMMEGIAKKKDVLAYFNGRKEKEIVIDPEKVSRVKRHILPEQFESE